MIDFNQKIKEMSKKYVEDNINNPSQEDYLLFETAMLSAAIMILEYLKEDKKG